MDTRTQIIRIMKLATQGLSVCANAHQLDHHREMIGLWLKAELPGMVIDQKENLNEPLWFVVKNPTGVDHEFAVAGLFMLVPEEEVIPETKLDPDSGRMLPRNIPVPIHLKVKAGETKGIQVSPRELAGEKNLGARYQFFCPKPKDIRVS